MVYPCDSYLA